MTELMKILYDLYDEEDEVVLFDDPDEDERVQTIWVYAPSVDPCHQLKIILSLSGEFIGFSEKRI